ncbi:MAG: hypothetical protein U0174_27730 [Polyangiaceae bacterium]
MFRTTPFVLLTCLIACGGGESRPPGTSAGAQGGEKGGDSDVGDRIVAAGGVEALSGGVSREALRLGPPLMARVILKGESVKLDGTLGEWPALTPMTGPNGKGSAAVAIQYDDRNMYIAVDRDGADPKIGGKGSASDDHAVFSIQFQGSKSAHEVSLFPGKPGESVGQVKVHGSAVAGAKIVEAPKKGGHGVTFEASIPWSTFPEAATLRLGLRGAVKYVSQDATFATADKTLPALLTEPEIAVHEGLLQGKGLGEEAPSYDVYADVAGDGARERISVYGSFLTICGPNYREGKQFFFREIGGTVVGLEAKNASGRGKDDLVIRRRIETGSVKRDVLEVWSFLTDEPTTVFLHEVKAQEGAKFVANGVKFRGGEIDVVPEPASGFAADSFRVPPIDGVTPLVLPWSEEKKRTFKFQKSHFTQSSPVFSASEPVRTATDSRAKVAAPVDEPKAAKPDTSGFGQRMLDDFRKSRNIAEGTKPRFDLAVHVAEDVRPERVLLFGRDLVVMGPGFRGGTRYEYITLDAFADGADVNELTAKDVTGDGTMELVVRGTRRIEQSGKTIVSECWFIYRVADEGIRRIFALEVARSEGGKRVQSLAQFVPAKGGRGFDIDVQPGTASGWDKSTYPFTEDKIGGAMEPLLLPWGTQKRAHYTWNGSKLAAQ